MIQLKIKYFRCWNDLNLTFQLGSTTLIKGSSGGGKTTLFQAIAWVLYGNIRRVSPSHLDKAKTKVELILPYTYNGINDKLSIMRQKNPNRLILQHGSITQEDKVAQSTINDLFGTFDVWISSCYINQGTRNVFLTAPNNGKMELLNSIAFHEEDPNIIIDKIDNYISDYKNIIQHATSKLNININALPPFDLSVDNLLTESQELQLLDEIKSLESQISQLKIININHQQQLSIFNTLSSQLQHYQQTSPNILSTITYKFHNQYFEDNLNNLEDIEHINNIINPLIYNLQKRDELFKDLTLTRNKVSNYKIETNISYSLDDYNETTKLEQLYYKNLQYAQSLNVSYDKDSIDNTIMYYEYILNNQDLWKREQEYIDIGNEINKLKLQIDNLKAKPLEKLLPYPEIIAKIIDKPDLTIFNTDNLVKELNILYEKQGGLQAHLKHLQSGLDILQCPQCTTNLRYQNKKLLLSEEAPSNNQNIVDCETKIKECSDNINKIKRQIFEYQTKEQQVKNQYDTEIQKENNRIEHLRRQTQQIERDNNKRQLNNDQIVQNIDFLQTQIVNLNNKLSSFTDIENISNEEKVILKGQEYNDMHKVVAMLKMIEIVDKPLISSENIKRYLDWKLNKDELDKKEEIYNGHLYTIDEKFRLCNLEEVKNYSKFLAGRSREIIEVEEYNRSRMENIRKLQEQIDLLDIGEDKSEDIKKLENDVNDCRQRIEMSRKIKILMDEYKKVEEEREEVIRLSNEFSSMNKLKQIATETECLILQQIVDDINNSISNICSSLFDHDININLSLFKTSKTTKNTKPSVNFNIAYKGGLYDNINLLSGGEGDRASLALTLALNRLSGCPLLMLDETLASLDSNLKDMALKVINENTNTTVLIIMHDGVEGVFDNVIDIDDLKK